METPEEKSARAGNDQEKSRSWANFGEIAGLIRLQWPKYLIDIVVIIVGISISFMLDNRKDEANRASSEQVYLKSLLDDFSADVEELQDVVAETREVIEKGKSILSLTDHPEQPVKDVAQFSSDFKQILARPNFVSNDATFSDLKSSGNMQLLSDTRLKSALFSYYRLYESNRAVETAEREMINTIIAPYLMRQFSIREMRNDNDDKTTILKKGVEFNKLLADNDFENVVTLRVINRSELLEGYNEELDQAQKIKARLELNLSGKK